MTKFSVIIPTYNRSNLITRSIKSVLDQTYKNFEIIVVDDASTDDTVDIIRTFDDQRIKLLQHQDNKGVSAARNTGIKNSVGNIISLLDSDDEMLPQFLERINNLFEKNIDIDFCWTGIVKERVNKNDFLIQKILHYEIWTPKFKNNNEAFYYCLRNTPYWGAGYGVCFKKELFHKIGYFNENIKSHEDMEFLIRLMKNMKFAVAEDYLIRIHNDAPFKESANYKNKINAYIIIYELNNSYIQQDSDSFIYINKTLLGLYKINKMYIDAIKINLRIIKKFPLSIVSYKYLLSTLTYPIRRT